MARTMLCRMRHLSPLSPEGKFAQEPDSFQGMSHHVDHSYDITEEEEECFWSIAELDTTPFEVVETQFSTWNKSLRGACFQNTKRPR